MLLIRHYNTFDSSLPAGDPMSVGEYNTPYLPAEYNTPYLPAEYDTPYLPAEYNTPYLPARLLFLVSLAPNMASIGTSETSVCTLRYSITFYNT
jgi:hypothetical protein